MSEQRIFIAGAGLISPLGHGQAATVEALRHNLSAIRTLDLFPLCKGEALPVGQVALDLDPSAPLPRTHQLALIAAREAMTGAGTPAPDAIVLGTTTGGLLTSEPLLRTHAGDPALYRYHGLTTVTEYLGRELGCHGPCLTVSTACSSGALAIALALEMLRAGLAQRVLAGGVDSLCRLTYFGFHSLQLVDRTGCRPLDRNRQGMAVAEGAAMLLLTSERPAHPLAELAGAGLSCDAHHPAAPHPEGDGAYRAMQAALADAGLSPAGIDYINLHGTGTRENDLAEAKAVTRLFVTPPPLSSIKGASGHSLAAAGAIEAAVAALSIAHDLIPANTGLREVDPVLGLHPVGQPLTAPVAAVLSNSFGFGGNNAALVLRSIASGTSPKKTLATPAFPPASSLDGACLAVHGYACLSGDGETATTLARLREGQKVAGRADAATIVATLPPRLVRRLQRLPRMALTLATAACASTTEAAQPDAVFLGTGWGALSEAWNFLTRLHETEEQFPSPTDFVGSVHNGPASQVAIHLGATGANVTCSGGDHSFEQALYAATLLTDGAPALVLGADECHEHFSPLLDPSIFPGTVLSDGGGALRVNRDPLGAICHVSRPLIQFPATDQAMTALIEGLDGATALQTGCAAVLAGIPAALHDSGEAQLARFLALSGIQAPVIRYRDLTGEFAAASALAAVLAVCWLEQGRIPAALVGGNDLALDMAPGRILLLGLGRALTAVEFFRP